MSEFNVGDLVECVRPGDSSFLKLGAMYEVDKYEVDKTGLGLDLDCLRVTDMDGRTEGGYYATRFVPVVGHALALHKLLKAAEAG